MRIVNTVDLPWMTSPAATGEVAPDDVDADGLVETDDDAIPAARYHHPGSETELQLFEVRLPSGQQVESHAHEQSEIIYVLEGSLRFGARVLTAGSSAFIPDSTLYGFRAGDDGVRFLNFRAVKDMSFITKDQFVASRGTERSPRADT